MTILADRKWMQVRILYHCVRLRTFPVYSFYCSLNPLCEDWRNCIPATIVTSDCAPHLLVVMLTVVKPVPFCLVLQDEQQATGATKTTSSEQSAFPVQVLHAVPPFLNCLWTAVPREAPHRSDL